MPAAGVRAGVSCSAEQSSEVAARLATIRALRSTGAVGFLVVFCGGSHTPQSYLNGVKSVVGSEVPIVGGSSAGVLSSSGLQYKSGFDSAVIAFPKSLGLPRVISRTGLDVFGANIVSQKVGAEVARVAHDNAVVLLLYDGVRRGNPKTSNDGSEVLKGFYNGLGSKPVSLFGGGVVGDMNMDTSFVLDGQAPTKHGVVALVFPPTVMMENFMTAGLKEVASGLRVTEASGRTITKIDGRPALEALSDALGGQGQSSQISQETALGVDAGAGTKPVYRHVFSTDEKSGAVVVSESDIKVGTQLSLARRTDDSMVSGVDQMMKDVKTFPVKDECRLLMVYSDFIYRAGKFSGSKVEEAERVSEKADPEVPMVGYFCSSTFWQDGDSNTRSYQWTATASVLYCAKDFLEKRRSSAAVPVNQMYSQSRLRPTNRNPTPAVVEEGANDGAELTEKEKSIAEATNALKRISDASSNGTTDPTSNKNERRGSLMHDRMLADSLKVRRGSQASTTASSRPISGRMSGRFSLRVNQTYDQQVSGRLRALSDLSGTGNTPGYSSISSGMEHEQTVVPEEPSFSTTAQIAMSFKDSNNDDDSWKLGKVATEDAIRKMDSSLDLDEAIRNTAWLLVFAGGRHDGDKLVEGIRSVVGKDIPIVGGAAVGVISQQGSGYKGYEVGITAFPLHYGGVQVIAEAGLDVDGERTVGRRIGQRVRAEADHGSTVLLLYDSIRSFPPPTLNVASHLLDGFYEGTTDSKKIIVIGAGTVSNMQMTDSYVFDGVGRAKHTALAVIISPRLQPHACIMHGALPISQEMMVTKAEGAVIHTLDDKPALDVVLELLGKDKGMVDGDFLSRTVMLGCKMTDRAEYTESDYKSRLILGIDKDVGTITLFEADFKTGDYLQVMSRGNSLMMESATTQTHELVQSLNGRKAVFSFFVDCVGRNGTFAGTEEEEADRVMAEVDSKVPFLGFYSGVEIGRVSGSERSVPLDYTGVLVLFTLRTDEEVFELQDKVFAMQQAQSPFYPAQGEHTPKANVKEFLNEADTQETMNPAHAFLDQDMLRSSLSSDALRGFSIEESVRKSISGMSDRSVHASRDQPSGRVSSTSYASNLSNVSAKSQREQVEDGKNAKLVISIGSSTLLETREAAVESVNAALEKMMEESDGSLDFNDLSQQVSLALVFAGGKHDVGEYAKGLRMVLPASVTIVGAGSVGTITHENIGYMGGESAVALFPKCMGTPRVLAAHGLDTKSEQDVGKELGEKIRENTKDGEIVFLFYDSIRSFPPPSLNVASFLLNGVYDGLGDRGVYIVGAGVVSDLQMSSSVLLLDDESVKHAAVALVLPERLEAFSVIMHGCMPISSPMEVTKAEGATIYTLDDRPAMDVVLELLGKTKADVEADDQFFSRVMTLGSKEGDPFEEYCESDYTSRLVIRANKDDGSIVLFEADFKTGDSVQVMSRGNKLMMESARNQTHNLVDALEGLNVLFAFYIDCAGRTGVFSGASEEEADIVAECVGDIPLFGFYSGVEIGLVAGRERSVPLDWTGILTMLTLADEESLEDIKEDEEVMVTRPDRGISTASTRSSRAISSSSMSKNRVPNLSFNGPSMVSSGLRSSNSDQSSNSNNRYSRNSVSSRRVSFADQVMGPNAKRSSNASSRSSNASLPIRRQSSGSVKSTKSLKFTHVSNEEEESIRDVVNRAKRESGSDIITVSVKGINEGPKKDLGQVGFSGSAMSTENNSFLNGEEVAKKAIKNLYGDRVSPDDAVNSVGWALAFCGGEHDPTEFLMGVRSVLGQDVTLVGGSTAGCISRDQALYAGIESCLTVFDHCLGMPKVMVAQGFDGDGEYSTGQLIGEAVSCVAENSSTVLVFYDHIRDGHVQPPQLNESQELLNGFYMGSRGKDLKIVGGGLLGDLQLSCSFLFDGRANEKHSAVAIVMPSCMVAHSVMTHGCHPVSDMVRITKVVGNTIFEIDDQPALSVVLKHIGKCELHQINQNAALGVNTGQPLDPYREGDFPVKLILKAEDNGAITMMEPYFKPNDTAYIMTRSNRSMLDASRKATTNLMASLEGAEPVFAFYMDYFARCGETCECEVEDSMSVLGGVGANTPSVGIFSGPILSPIPGMHRSVTSEWSGLLMIFTLDEFKVSQQAETDAIMRRMKNKEVRKSVKNLNAPLTPKKSVLDVTQRGFVDPRYEVRASIASNRNFAPVGADSATLGADVLNDSLRSRTVSSESLDLSKKSTATAARSASNRSFLYGSREEQSNSLSWQYHSTPGGGYSRGGFVDESLPLGDRPLAMFAVQHKDNSMSLQSIGTLSMPAQFDHQVTLESSNIDNAKDRLITMCRNEVYRAHAHAAYLQSELDSLREQVERGGGGVQPQPSPQSQRPVTPDHEVERLRKENEKLRSEVQFFKKRANTLGPELLVQQEVNTKLKWEARRSRATAKLIYEGYKLLNNNMTTEELEKAFLNVLLDVLTNTDRVAVLKYDPNKNVFQDLCQCGFSRSSRLSFSTKAVSENFLFCNSKTAKTPVIEDLCKTTGLPYFLWAYNEEEEIALLIGSVIEDPKFGAFSSEDKFLVEGALNVFLNLKKRRELDTIKDNFLARTSHELRTPLNGIIGIAESVLEGDHGEHLSTQIAENLELIVVSGRRLTNLVNDLLDFSSMRAGGISLRRHPVDMMVIVDLVFRCTQVLVKDKSVELLNDVPEQCLVEGDEDRLQQVVANLIGNAVKFTSRGHIRVSAKKLDGSNTWEFCVEDTGIGMEEGAQSNIFKSFEQAESSIAREYGGTGLGLAICKELIELHSGEIRVESTKDVGSCFYFTLPVSKDGVAPLLKGAVGMPVHEEEDNSKKRLSVGTMQSQKDRSDSFNSEGSKKSNRSRSVVESSRTRTSSSDIHGSSFQSTRSASSTAARVMQKLSLASNNPRERGLTFMENARKQSEEQAMHVLVVDDEPVNLQVLANQLSTTNFHVTQCSNGVDALKVIYQDGIGFDIVLLDVMMPKMSGLEVCQKIRQKYTMVELPVIMLTAMNQVQDTIAGLQSGANDYITKPFKKQELLARMKTHLTLSKITLAYARFVPLEFLRCLGKSTIVDVEFGSCIQKEMSILFSDIRSFTTISEGMTTKDLFNFLNEYLSVLEPAVMENNGFIDKYIGDAVMALFVDPDDCVRASIAMADALFQLNESRRKVGQQCISIGTGINTGSLMMGTVGGRNRMDGTVIGDEVNLASRTEGITKHFGATIMVTEYTMRNLKNVALYRTRFLGKVQVVGKKKPVWMYEVMDDNTPVMRLKTETKLEFEKALASYYNREFEKALNTFTEILETNPEDKAAALYVSRCETCLKDGISETWDGVERPGK